MKPEEKQKLDPSMMGKRRRIGVFGGSFNPIHNGHLLIAGDIVRQDLADEVMFVPARTPPHKRAESLVPAETRLQMTALAVEPYQQFSVSDVEVTSENGTGYTIDTMQSLARAYVDAELIFIIGMDSLRDLPNWFQAPQLVAQFRFLIYPRPGVLPPAHADLAAKLGPRNATRLLSAIVDSPSVAIDATGIRQAVHSGKMLAGLVPAIVETFITEHNLYRNEPDAPERPYRAATESQ